MQTNRRVKTLTFMGIFIAVIVIQNYIPLLGYIPLGFFDITIIQITVILAGILLGPVSGGIIGGIWGLLDFIRAITFTSSVFGNIVMSNPIIAIVPRILIGVFAGIVFNFYQNKNKSKQFSSTIAAIIGSLTNTILVLLFIYLFFKNGSTIYQAINFKKLVPFLLSIAFIHGIPELIFSATIVPLIIKASRSNKIMNK